MGLGGGCIATRGYFQGLGFVTAHCYMCCVKTNDPLRSHLRSAMGYSYLLKEIGAIKRFYSVYDVYYGLLHFIQPSVITKCGFIPEKRS